MTSENPLWPPNLCPNASDTAKSWSITRFLPKINHKDKENNIKTENGILIKRNLTYMDMVVGTYIMESNIECWLYKFQFHMKVYNNMTSDDPWMTSDEPIVPLQILAQNGDYIHQIPSPYENLY